MNSAVVQLDYVRFLSQHSNARVGRAAAAARQRNPTPQSHPSALPSINFYQTHPERVGPTGNVRISEASQLEPWLLVARPVSREEAEKYGGCIIYSPPSPPGKTNKKRKKQQPSQYYCITDTDDEVYGRAAYLPRWDCESGAKDSGYRIGTLAKFLNSDESESCSAQIKGANRRMNTQARSDSYLSLTSDSVSEIYFGEPIQ